MGRRYLASAANQRRLHRMATTPGGLARLGTALPSPMGQGAAWTRGAAYLRLDTGETLAVPRSRLREALRAYEGHVIDRWRAWS